MNNLILILFLFITTKAMAFDLCSYQQTSQIEISRSKVSKRPSRFTFAEKNLVHRTIALENYNRGISRPEALEIFTEASSEGKIVYFSKNGKDYILVHYWPGDNEYGAFYLVSEKSAPKLIASIGDSFITCIEE
jgi:hypothetical protein